MSASPIRFELHGLWAAAATLAGCLPILLGFLLPATVLLIWAIDTAPRIVDARYVSYAANTFLLSAVAAIVAVIVAMIIAYGQRLRPNRVMSAATRIASMGYAVPGAVIAVGVLIPFAALDNWLDELMIDRFGISTGLLLSGTIVAVIFAYLVRFLAISLNTVESSLAKITRHMDDAARTLGQRPTATLLKVHLPITWGSLLTAAILVFVDVMKELPATLLLRPFNFDTLAIRAYQLASDERLADAASPSLAIVLVGIVPVILLSIAIARSRPGTLTTPVQEEFSGGAGDE